MTIKLTDALTVTPEEMDNMTVEQLQELHTVLENSNQKKAKLRLDIVTAQLKKLEKAGEKEVVENSVKVKPKATGTKPKAKAGTTRPKAGAGTAKPKAGAGTKIETPAEEKKKTSTRTAPKAKTLEEMSQQELVAYIKAMEEKQSREVFPKMIPGKELIDFKQIEIKTYEDIQKHILENPLHLHLYMDEKIDDKLTQFVVLFANADVIVMMDKSREVHTTITCKPEELKDGMFHDKKAKEKFPVRFYLRVPKEQPHEEQEQEEKGA